jgi:hypothetical protein
MWHGRHYRSPRARFCRAAFVFCLSLAITSCRPAQKYDAIENELRGRERELAEAKNDLAYARQLNDAYQSRGEPGCPTPAGSNGVAVQDLVLGSGTGGVDDDGNPGDESFQVVVVPRDLDTTPIKVPGKLTVKAYEIGRDGIKTCIGTWDITPEQLRRTWRGGLLATGYFVPLAWDKPPATERVRLAVRFTTLDGKAFEADRDVSVRPLLAGRLLPPLNELPPRGFEALPGPRGPEELPPPMPNGGANYSKPAIFSPPQEWTGK